MSNRRTKSLFNTRARCKGSPTPSDFLTSGTQSRFLTETSFPGSGTSPSHAQTKYSQRADITDAVSRLDRDTPEFSARHTIWPWQRNFLLAVCAALAISVWVNLHATMVVLFAALAIPFLLVGALRLLAIWHISTRASKTPNPTRAQTVATNATASATDISATDAPDNTDDDLPSYAILVPLFKEAHVVPGLLKALSRIDYPTDRLQISIITESIDEPTRSALEAANLADHIRVVAVPDGTPRTKPRALNFALQTAIGDMVVVYDAEDIPAPDQLRRAVATLRAHPDNTGCIQACLNVYNPRENWFTRQFTIEYTSLFDALLPALEHMEVPIPLGGTSNHFPRHVLERIGAWDPYNVTEDADLGIRLARFGYRVRVLDSTTWEEAPDKWSVWRGQRTRWMKGWMQTYLVHMRQPARLANELGPQGFFKFQVLMVGMILSPLVHPLFYLALGVELFSSGSITAGQGAQTSTVLNWLFWIGLVNLIIGYLSAIVLGAISVSKRGWRYLIADCVTMPFYWLLISWGAYRALLELITKPHHWEKTDHALIRNWALPKPRRTPQPKKLER